VCLQMIVCACARNEVGFLEESRLHDTEKTLECDTFLYINLRVISQTENS